MEIKIIDMYNKFYPEQLKKIKNPPKRLYVIGDETILNNDCLSIIGSRNCTEYGANIAKVFAKKIAEKGITIVSGMAYGIDSQAHLGAIEGGGKTIAVLGSGFNHIFPDKEIFNKILEYGGTIITEYDNDVEVFSQGFRDRNRIVAGLSIGTFVIEAKEKSGTGITANYAKQFKRNIFCIPHRIEDESGKGTNRLLKNGAILVTEIEDILKYYNNIKQNAKTEKKLEIEIPEEYKKVYEEIKIKDINADEISKKINMNIAQVNAIITMLELEGYIESRPGNFYRRRDFINV